MCGSRLSPWNFTPSETIARLTHIRKLIGSDRVLAVGGGVTFYGLLALFPTVTAFVSIYGLFADRNPRQRCC